MDVRIEANTMLGIRLALAHNQITDFPAEFSSLSRIRYLNLRSNCIREFPLAVRVAAMFL